MTTQNLFVPSFLSIATRLWKKDETELAVHKNRNY